MINVNAANISINCSHFFRFILLEYAFIIGLLFVLLRQIIHDLLFSHQVL